LFAFHFWLKPLVVCSIDADGDQADRPYSIEKQSECTEAINGAVH